MAVSKVKKTRLISLTKYQKDILDFLYDFGSVEIIAPSQESSNQGSSLEYDFAQVKFAVKFLTTHNPAKQKLVDKLTDKKIEITQKELDKLAQTFQYKNIVNDIVNFEERLNQAQNNIKKFQEEKLALTPWTNLSIAPDELDAVRSVQSKIGILNQENYSVLLKKSEKISNQISIDKINTVGQNIFVQLTFERKTAQKINNIINNLNWSEATLPYTSKPPKQAVEDLSKKISEERKAIKDTTAKIRKYAKEHLKNLKIISDYLSWQLEKKTAEQHSSYTKETFYIDFWIETRNIKKLEKELDKITKDYSLDELKIKDESEIPVVLKNNNFFSAFEAVTNIYGAPKEDEPDPTPFLAPFFIVFFGLALSDAGYGIVLALGTYLVMTILKIPKENSKLLRVLFWGGISTFVFGALFGSWFGIKIASMPEFIQKLQVIDPVKDPITILILTMILGVIQIITGIIIDVWWKIKSKNTKEAILGPGVWLYFLLSLVFWVTTKVGVLPDSLSQISLYMVYAGIALLILTQGRKAKNPVLKILQGTISLYDLVGYFSDMLSYSRLLALGLATGIIAMVVNLIAFLFKDMIPYAGWIVAIVILVGGHIFNIAINVLGAYIHSGRLQFVEFFPKFMEGGGKRFKPLSKEAYFIKIINR